MTMSGCPIGSQIRQGFRASPTNSPGSFGSICSRVPGGWLNEAAWRCACARVFWRKRSESGLAIHEMGHDPGAGGRRREEPDEKKLELHPERGGKVTQLGPAFPRGKVS